MFTEFSFSYENILGTIVIYCLFIITENYSRARFIRNIFFCMFNVKYITLLKIIKVCFEPVIIILINYTSSNLRKKLEQIHKILRYIISSKNKLYCPFFAILPI